MIRSTCAKMVPKLLTPEQKESRMDICADILNIHTDPGLLARVDCTGAAAIAAGMEAGAADQAGHDITP
ncbi:hypothetical protein NQ318_009900 [Aromia moschata]|uniref:Uncharacterized protein n=1 Tax=Aromia moschata TaxID=1265417 RepID=A0AAV8Y5E0_9CUCU|nr:hypothetical protein NQ318_009900 [Aromia moschata]